MAELGVLHEQISSGLLIEQAAELALRAHDPLLLEYCVELTLLIGLPAEPGRAKLDVMHAEVQNQHRGGR